MTQPGGSPQRREVTVNGQRVKVIDVHAHCAIPEAHDARRRLERLGRRSTSRAYGRRLEDMDEQGIDVEALSINPFWYARRA